ncbi:hypothetical protein [Yoonia sp. BS5-3]|uniref:SGNH/GDSL hydrolase family protein n=1 Tax=Yoonia phaeophyticola TaxID=3137369 RepID=A0ABZ2V3H1_9RHOB
MTIDLVVISDSHGRAIANGAAQLGLEVRTVTYSGALWHRGKFRFTRNGFQPTRSKAPQRQMRELHEELKQKDLSLRAIPTISTIGFHLGQLVPPFGWYGHRALPEEFEEKADAKFTSDAFLHEYVQTYRRKHFEIAKKMHQYGRFMVIPSPVTFRRANYAAFRAHIVDQFHTRGISLYDPVEDLAQPDGILGDKFIAKDGVHANAEYGAQVVRLLKQKGFLST